MAYAFAQILLGTLGPWEDIHEFLRLASVNIIYKCLKNYKKILQEAEAAIQLGVYILSLKKVARLKKAEKGHKEGKGDTGSAHHYIFTAGCGGVFPAHPKEDILCSHTLFE